MSLPPVWIDANILIYIQRGLPGYEAELALLRSRGHEILIPQAVETEFLHGQGSKPEHAQRAQRLLERLNVRTDTMANRVPMRTLHEWRTVASQQGLSIPDAHVVAQVRAGGQARGISNPVLYTQDAGGTLVAMRRQHVDARALNIPPSSPPPAAPGGSGPPGGIPRTRLPPTPTVRTPRTPVVSRTIDELEGIAGRLGRVTPPNRGAMLARTLQGFGAGLILGLIGSYLQARTDRKQIESDLNRIEGEVQSFLRKQGTTALIAKSQILTDKDQRVYVSYEIEIHHGQPRWGRYKYPYDATISAWLAPTGIDILTLNEQQKRWRSGVTREGQDPENHPVIESYPQFVEIVVYTEDELNAFHELQDLYLTLSLRSKIATHDYELLEQLQEVKEKIVQKFGTDLWFLD